jgi:HPt (histidine-containing phosphotransfer) domain-containing protein
MNTDANTTLDLSYLDLMADGDNFMKKTMIDMLIEELPPELEKLRNSFLQQDGETMHQVAHKMKSTLAFIGNPTMDEANSTCEQIGKEGTDMQRAGSLIEILEAQAKMVVPLLQAESAKLG